MKNMKDKQRKKQKHTLMRQNNEPIIKKWEQMGEMLTIHMEGIYYKELRHKWLHHLYSYKKTSEEMMGSNANANVI